MSNKDIHSEIASIKDIMERSSKFISLSGLSGIMAGVYALIGAYISYKLVYPNNFSYRNHYVNEPEILFQLASLATAVLLLSIITGIWLTLRKAKKNNQNVWNPSSKRLLMSLAIPLLTGGILILIMIYRGAFGFVAPACLIFYGLSLVAGSQFTYKDVRWLGICEIILGLAAALVPGYGLIFWTIGFGLLHILYGSIMHFKYDK